MPADYHVHTNMCGHATGEMEEYVERATARGLSEIGFSDHVPMYFLPLEERDHSIAMEEAQLPQYIAKVKTLQQKYSPFPIKLGLEADFVPGQEERLKAMFDQHDFDYILGSVHYIDGWGFDNPAYVSEYTTRDLEELYNSYFELVAQTALSGLFDIIAHPDLIKKFGFVPKCDLNLLYYKTVRAIAESGTCVEVNTAGLRVAAKEVYPNYEFLKLCREYDIDISLGSDAHAPEMVGEGFVEVIPMLKEIGFDKTVIFSNRQKSYIAL